jgi:uncharacterized membrane protein YgcG
MDGTTVLGLLAVIAGWLGAVIFRRSPLVRELRFIRDAEDEPTGADTEKRRSRPTPTDWGDSGSGAYWGDSDGDGDSGGAGGSD